MELRWLLIAFVLPLVTAFDILVQQDAVYAVPGSNGCSGFASYSSFSADTDKLCPKKGQVAHEGCDAAYASFNADLKQCIAPEDAEYNILDQQYICIFPSSYAPRISSYLFFTVLLVSGIIWVIAAACYSYLTRPMLDDDLTLSMDILPHLPSECIIESLPQMALPVGPEHRESVLAVAIQSPVRLPPASFYNFAHYVHD